MTSRNRPAQNTDLDRFTCQSLSYDTVKAEVGPFVQSGFSEIVPPIERKRGDLSFVI